MPDASNTQTIVERGWAANAWTLARMFRAFAQVQGCSLGLHMVLLSTTRSLYERKSTEGRFPSTHTVHPRRTINRQAAAFHLLP